MRTDNGQGLDARKQPQQARSQATVDAIFDATIQVLLAEGLQRLTTIRVAERAGVSVGTLYQYFPQKQALLFAVLQRHLERVVKAIEDATASAHNACLSTMVKAVVAAFVKAKTENLDESRALYAVALELDSRGYVREVEARNRAALEAMLKTASDAHFDDMSTTIFMFTGALVGPMRLLLESKLPQSMIRKLRGQLESLCLGYLEREARPKGSAN
ncbi:HTH-type transcriptional regulator BetI [Paraburkholderia aspalathi]|uniref:HTH-type transcriptional regulator BetI n=2 Tax=Paraburkholderia aspalathi TaxID=1324617 RepID=A0ABM8QQJ2_9BURK|nr:TetR/AcrR family transcriptional regulator [Paraburkholderia aspalathi]MBK3817692.1 TetR/AcrR family transcriptional regulator [Paraburkholderia aspalathi]MBK3829411.1 TetR/AcrR family transcriptional regulator [Paraburkholderia aspalathi]MBK3859096.1 TetR/AcrR family transcriptional regulator [Paraburkholderia aspalathi]CAE6709905.1 HTH-type transcriptional regulator BetI [Paraburkholderia aspalathi]